VLLRLPSQWHGGIDSKLADHPAPLGEIGDGSKRSGITRHRPGDDHGAGYALRAATNALNKRPIHQIDPRDGSSTIWACVVGLSRLLLIGCSEARIEHPTIDVCPSDDEDADRFRFQPLASPGVALPKSYQGTSGGGLWHFYLAEDDFSVVQARLVGVAYFEKPVGDELHLLGHGQISIYDTLYKAIRKKWS
jgi:hypothetical protein